MMIQQVRKSFLSLLLFFSIPIYAQQSLGLEWAVSMGGTSHDIGYSITTDALGNVYTTGSFYGTVDFDPGMGTLNITSAGGDDIFIQKLDPNGNLIWAKSMGGTGDDYGQSVTTDALGNVYTTGNFAGTVDFDPDVGTLNLTSNGGSDIFIQKLDSNGNLLWAKTMGGASTVFGDEGLSITTDALGNVYITGIFSGYTDFIPGTGTLYLNSNGGSDIFVQKLDPNGNLIWAKSMGANWHDFGMSITTDALENVYTTGCFKSTVDFDPGAGTLNLSSVGSSNIFIQKLDSNGNLMWAKSMGGTNNDVGYSITTDALGNVYTTGYFRETVDFDPSVGAFGLTSAGGSADIFIQKLNQCYPNSSIDTQTACDSYTWIDGNTYTSNNNTATHTLTNSAGCDSVVTLNLTITNSSTGIDTQTACDSYTWIDGNTYTSNNLTATHTIPNAAGCDSVVNLDLTINNSSTSIDTQTALCSYTWIDGNTYTSNNNTATHTLSNATGCDSVVTLDLTIVAFTATVSVSGNTLTAQPPGGSYQWLDCDGGYAPIAGETNNNYTPTSSGNYAVAIDYGVCKDTSDCESVTLVGLQENKANTVGIYPNPTTGILTIEGAEGIASIYDIYGRLVLTTNTNILDISKAATGIYFVRVLDEQGKVYVAKVMKD